MTTTATASIRSIRFAIISSTSGQLLKYLSADHNTLPGDYRCQAGYSLILLNHSRTCLYKNQNHRIHRLTERCNFSISASRAGDSQKFTAYDKLYYQIGYQDTILSVPSSCS